MGRELAAALTAAEASTRLKAALAIGSDPDPELVDAVVSRCAIEPDFYVRDMLTWALTRFSSNLVVPKLLAELRSEITQARSQALHTLSKIRDAATWPAITSSLLHDVDDEVARSAWRAAVILVPDGQQKNLAENLVLQLGRGDRQLQLSLSRALIALGEEAEPVLRRAMSSGNAAARAHAAATLKLLQDPEAAFTLDINEARRVFALDKKNERPPPGG